jgi:anti-sigma regulatory factor (Ser/Thr protein kinase)
VSAPRRLGSPVADADDEVVGSPDTAAGPLDRPPLAGPAPQRHWRLPATVRSVTVLRRALEDCLRQVQLSDDERYDLLLVACEATSNAIEHAWNPTEPFVEVLAEIGDARVTITVCDSGRWRDAVAGTDRGRGLQMMWLLADTTVAAGRHGTTVTIRSSPRHGRLPATPHGERGASNGSPTSCPGTG